MKKWLVLALACSVALVMATGEKVSSPLLTAPAKVAQKEKKLVFVSFSASWCGPCRQLHKTLEHAPVKPIWDKYFTSVTVIVDENGDKKVLNTPGGDELRKKLNGANCGIPFFAYLTPDGKVVGNSFADPANNAGNIGCPMSSQEIASFMETLKKIAPKMTEDERKTIQTAFEEANKPVEAHATPAGPR